MPLEIPYPQPAPFLPPPPPQPPSIRLVFFWNSPIRLIFSGLSYKLQQVGKFLSNSKMGHIQASKMFHHSV